MSIIRTRKHAQYVAIEHSVLSDLSLSWEAKGLHCYLLSRPDHWRVSVEHLARKGRGAGRDKLYRIIDELIERGYAERTQRRMPSGRVNGYEYIVHEIRISRDAEKLSTGAPPFPEKPYTGLPDTAEPSTADATLANIENKLINNYSASNDEELGKHWRPSRAVLLMLTDLGISQTFIDDLTPEFILYWRDRNPFAGRWDTKFTKHVIRRWKIRCDKQLPKPAPEVSSRH